MAMGLEISQRAVNGVTIVDLEGRATIGANTDKLDHALRDWWPPVRLIF